MRSFSVPVCALVGFLHGCGLCGTSHISQPLFSLNKKFAAYSYSYDCGATSRFSLNVAVTRTGEAPPNDTGNVVGLPPVDDLSLKWLDDSTLQVRSADNVLTYKVSS